MKNILDLKNEKITEKVFLQSIIVSIVSILLCIIMLCSLTYAWFTSETESGSNTIISGSFDVKIAVSNVADESAIESNLNDKGKYYYELQPGTYEISFKLTEESTVDGHCMVMIGSDAVQHTDAIIETSTADTGNENMPDFKFTIKVTEKTTVILEPLWGVVVEPDISNGELIDVIADLSDEGEENQSVE